MIFFATPVFYILAIYVLAAIVPAGLLMRYIYRHDRVEKEPAPLLGALVVRGVLSALAACALEYFGSALLNSLIRPSNPYYVVWYAFVVVAAVEEGAKFFFLYRRTWHDSNFNYRFDGVVYAVFVSLGFAAFENILYVFRFGLSVALTRAFLSIPGHMGFAVFMGVFYSRAKLLFSRRQPLRCRWNLAAGYLIAVSLHGVYDTCCMMGTSLSTLVFLAFVVAMYIVVFAVIKRESKMDRPIL